MKKKLFAALCAAMLSLCVLGTTAASAAEMTYQKGDFTMDGKVDIDDAIEMLNYFGMVYVVGHTEYKKNFTDEQIALGDVYQSDDGYDICPLDCITVCKYYTLNNILGIEATMEEVISIWIGSPLPIENQPR